MTATITRTKWAIDKIHSAVQFKVKHLAISTVTGTFRTFQGEVVAPSDTFDRAEVRFTIDADSIDTNHSDRDRDLKSPAFLNTESFPQITFKGILSWVAPNYQLQGDLTIRGITKPILLEVEHGGIGKGRFGDTRAGFEVTGKLNRKDFGITMNILTEASQLVVGEEVKLHFDIQLVKNPE